MTHHDTATIDYYARNAAAFVAGTAGACVSEALGRFVALLPEGGRVLDWGCGSGRWFTDLDEDGLAALLEGAFEPLDVWVSEDVRPGREGELWVNGLGRKR